MLLKKVGKIRMTEKLSFNNKKGFWLGKKLSKKHRRKISKSMKGINKGKTASFETRKKSSESHIKFFLTHENPLKGFKHTRTTRKKMSEAHIGKILSLETRRKISEYQRGTKHPHSEETKKKLSKINRGKKHSLKTRKKISEALKNRIISLETGRKISAAKKGKSLSEINLRNILKSNCARPNKFEIRALAYLELLYPKRFSYTGDGTCIINRRSADALDLKTRTVALFNGAYWHLVRHGLKINDKNKRLREKIEAKPFLDMGYRVIFIWEDELNLLNSKKYDLITKKRSNICSVHSVK